MNDAWIRSSPTWGARLFAVALLFASFSFLQSPIHASQEAQSFSGVRIGVTPVFLANRTAFLKDWRAYLERRINRPVHFVQRSRYQEIMDLLMSGDLEFAWICGYPFVQYKTRIDLVSVPLYNGTPYYQSYLIVSDEDTSTQSIVDLEDKLFAFSDPSSNSGYLVPQAQLWKADIDPDAFFEKTFFTWAHRKVIKAVAYHVADAGAVDGYVWDTLGLVQPRLVGKTRVVSKSRKYGFPPVVARKGVAQELFDSFQRALLDMDKEPDGTRLLKTLNLDGFSIQSPSLFKDIEVLAREVPGN